MSWLFLILLFLDIPFSVNAGIPGDAEMADIKPNTAEGHNYSATLNIMHSYIASKSSKEEEKRKLQRRNAELKAEREQLETKSQQLKLNMQVGLAGGVLVSWLSLDSPIHASLSPFFWSAGSKRPARAVGHGARDHSGSSGEVKELS